MDARQTPKTGVGTLCPAKLSTFGCIRGRVCLPFCSAGPWHVFPVHTRCLWTASPTDARVCFPFCRVCFFLFAALGHGTSSLSIPDVCGQRRQWMPLLIKRVMYRCVALDHGTPSLYIAEFVDGVANRCHF